MVTFEQLREIALRFPGVEEGSSYGTPGFRVKGKFLGRMWEDGETFVLKIGFEESAMLIDANPDVYFKTDHYAGYPAVLVRLPRIDADELASIFEQAWRQLASMQHRVERAQSGP